jgi:hypothetical protein
MHLPTRLPATRRVGIISVGLLLTALGHIALAQSTDSDRQFEAGRSFDRQNWEWRAQRGVAPTEAETAVQAVVDAIARRDCPGAVAALNAGLKKSLPEVFTLAGGLYEEGVCLKPNWERAVALYQRAEAAGQPGAAARIAAGFAAPVGGSDGGSALWWALRAKTPMPADCAAVAPLAADADKFVAALNAWPAGQLGACVYAAAVMAGIQAETASPALAGRYGLAGRVTVSFVPAEGRVDIEEALTDVAPPTGLVIDAATLASNRQASRKAFSTFLRQLADRALARHSQPAEVPASWRVEATFDYATGR